jgi:demethylmenaquinone methyltransferase/2-methoxy-6-polyprenyl-1,4-benzoquinol methylase
MAQLADGDGVASVLAAQRAYYDQRAPDYLGASASDRASPGALSSELLDAVVDELAPRGDVLELACGPGGFTRALARHASSLTAVDGSPAMLARNRAQFGADEVTFVEADLFAWEPDDRYDVVFFGFWLSHVPPSRFDDFWALVAGCLRPGGRVAFVDEDDRAAERADGFEVDGLPLATRTLRDGRTVDIVKVFWEPSDLQRRLDGIGWDVDVTPIGASFLVGTGGRRG